MSRSRVWGGMLAGALLLGVAGCGIEPLTAYGQPDLGTTGRESFLIPPFMDSRTFIDNKDPLKEGVGEYIQHLFAEVLREHAPDADIRFPEAYVRPKGSMTVDQVAELGRLYGGDYVISGQIFNFNEGRPGSGISARAGMFIRIVSAADGRLVFVGDHYIFGGMGKSFGDGARDRQAREVAKVLIGSFLPSKAIGITDVPSSTAPAHIVPLRSPEPSSLPASPANEPNRPIEPAEGKDATEPPETGKTAEPLAPPEVPEIPAPEESPETTDTIDAVDAKTEPAETEETEDADRTGAIASSWAWASYPPVAKLSTLPPAGDADPAEDLDEPDSPAPLPPPDTESSSADQPTTFAMPEAETVPTPAPPSIPEPTPVAEPAPVAETLADSPAASPEVLVTADAPKKFEETVELALTDKPETAGEPEASTALENYKVTDYRVVVEDGVWKIVTSEGVGAEAASGEGASGEVASGEGAAAADVVAAAERVVIEPTDLAPIPEASAGKTLEEVNVDPRAAVLTDRASVAHMDRARRPGATRVLLLPYFDVPNPDNLIPHTGGGEVVTALMAAAFTRTGEVELLLPSSGRATHDRVVTPTEAVALGREVGARYVLSGRGVEFRRAQSTPSWLSAAISTYIIATQIIFAEISGVEIETRLYDVDTGRLCHERRDVSRQKYVVQAEKTVRRLVAGAVPAFLAAIRQGCSATAATATATATATPSREAGHGEGAVGIRMDSRP